MQILSFKELLDMISDYVYNEVDQKKPVIVWFENMELEILEYSNSKFSDPAGLGQTLCTKYRCIANAITSGELRLSYNESNDWKKEQTDTKKNDFPRFSPPSFVIQKVTRENIPKTKFFIFSPFDLLSEDYESSLKRVNYIHSILNIPVLIFFKFDWKDQLKGIFTGCEEYLCAQSNEDKKTQWFERVSQKNELGFQIIDNFYLDFLKQVPNEMVSYDIGSGERLGFKFCNFARWEQTTSRLPKEILNIITFGNKWGEEITAEQRTKFRFSFKDGNLDLKKFSEVLDTIPEQIWNDWIKEHQYSFENNKNLQKDSNRIEYVVTRLCDDLFFLNILPSVQKELLKFNLSRLSNKI